MPSEELAVKQREASAKHWAHFASVVQGCIDVDDRRGYDPNDAREREMREELLDVLREARSKAKAAMPLAAVPRRPLLLVPQQAPRRSAARAPRSRSVRRTASRARGPDDPLGSEPALGVAARAEVQRILDAEARRILASPLEGDAIVPAPGSDEGTLKDGLDDPAPAFEAQAVPTSGSVENDGGSVDAL